MIFNPNLACKELGRNIGQSGESICGHWGLKNFNNFNNCGIFIMLIFTMKLLNFLKIFSQFSKMQKAHKITCNSTARAIQDLKT